MDYRGDVGVILGNMSQGIIPLSRGTRIAQLKLSAAPDIDWEVIDEISETERGDGGFGSTGIAADVAEISDTAPGLAEAVLAARRIHKED